MIKLKSAHIEEVRGIRKLDIDFGDGKTFAISGPNGSGKSGVIDAIEFGLTGQIGRLTGRGTGGLSVSDHGPHVDKTKFPDAAFVELKVFLPEIGKSATITRKISAPKKPKIVPADSDIKAALAEVAEHPEIMLSRREILRFILVEPTKRSEEIQSILKLDDIGQTRSALNTAQNKLQAAQRTATAQMQSGREALQLHLQIPTLRAADLLEAVNTRRKLLELPEIGELTADTKLDAGLSDAAKLPEFNKQSAIRDLQALAGAAKGFPDLGKTEVAAILSGLAKLAADPALLSALQRRSFIEKGLDLVNSTECPLCDHTWENEQRLREHLKAKLVKSAEARKLQDALQQNGAVMERELIQVLSLLGLAQKVAAGQGDEAFAQLLTGWKTDLDGLKAKLMAVDSITVLKDRLTAGWLAVPKNFPKSLKALTEKIQAKPDQTAALDAQTFLTTAQIRLGDYREVTRKNKAAEIAWSSANAAYEIYCSVMEDELNTLYEDVQADFSTFYRAINEDDEAKFTAKLTPSEGKLDFDVNFYERGLFPPGAYHSEGHQDGMGVCLYLALMKRLFAARFTFALLDDVVMSVDASHRYLEEDVALPVPLVKQFLDQVVVSIQTKANRALVCLVPGIALYLNLHCFIFARRLDLKNDRWAHPVAAKLPVCREGLESPPRIVLLRLWSLRRGRGNRPGSSLLRDALGGFLLLCPTLLLCLGHRLAALSANHTLGGLGHSLLRGILLRIRRRICGLLLRRPTGLLCSSNLLPGGRTHGVASRLGRLLHVKGSSRLTKRRRKIMPVAERLCSVQCFQCGDCVVDAATLGAKVRKNLCSIHV
jgi:hypothetical protein